MITDYPLREELQQLTLVIWMEEQIEKLDTWSLEPKVMKLVETFKYAILWKRSNEASVFETYVIL